MKRILIAVGGVALVLAAVLVVNTLRLAKPDPVTVETALVEVDLARVTANLRRAITYRTLSVEPGKPWDAAPFDAFLTFLAGLLSHV